MSEEIEDLEQLKIKTDLFIQDTFDWVSTVGQVSLLQNLYDFKNNIDNKIKELQGNEAEKKAVRDPDEMRSS